MKIVGTVFILLSAGSVGLQLSKNLKKRCSLLQKLLLSVRILQSEILFNGTPLPQAFALAAAATEGSCAALFSDVAKEMDKRRWLTPQAAMELCFQNQSEINHSEEICGVLRTLAAGLGKYDHESQRHALERAAADLDTIRVKAEQERCLRGKTYEMLGICAGISLVILLI